MEKNAGLSDLSWRSQIEISGTDAKDFLHGQFSNDLMALDGCQQSAQQLFNT